MAVVENTSWNHQKIIQVLLKSPHGEFTAYVEPMRTALQSDEEFCAHMVAWNEDHGKIRDAKSALPVLGYLYTKNPIFESNYLAHLAMRNPIDLLKCWHFAHELKLGKINKLNNLVEKYIRHREKSIPMWDRTALQFRKAFKQLYKLSHTKPSGNAQHILFDEEYPRGSVFDVVARLKDMSDNDIGQSVNQYKIPFLVLTGALGSRIKEPEVLLSVIQSMTPNEVVINTKMLMNMGVTTTPETRAAYELKLQQNTSAKKSTLLKTSVAATHVTDERLKAQLQGQQERQFNVQSGIEGNWLILGDRSPSMGPAIEYTRQLAAFMARSIKGNVHCIFFDQGPRYFDFTGKTYEDICAVTSQIETGSATSIGCGIGYCLTNNIDVDALVVVTDGQENRPPFFVPAYQKYCERLGKDIPVYYYYIFRGFEPLSITMEHAGIEYKKFDIDEADYYSIPMIAETMRVNPYSLAQEIYDTPLRTVESVFTRIRERV